MPWNCTSSWPGHRDHQIQWFAQTDFRASRGGEHADHGPDHEARPPRSVGRGTVGGDHSRQDLCRADILENPPYQVADDEYARVGERSRVGREHEGDTDHVPAGHRDRHVRTAERVAEGEH
ncbi:hypothetical protein [Mycobacterium sp.]|uniref:hypothetical protein n=1 Tax=Mycobacterium sp. TaxID=1785 RepID=UPI003F969C92